MSAWSLVPAPVRPLPSLVSRAQRYGHCYDGQAGDRVRSRRAYAALQAAVRAARVLQIRGQR